MGRARNEGTGRRSSHRGGGAPSLRRKRISEGGEGLTPSCTSPLVRRAGSELLFLQAVPWWLELAMHAM